MTQQRYLSTTQFWKELRQRGVPIGRECVRRAARSGSLRSIKPTAVRHRIPSSELDDWPERLLDEPKAKK